MSESAPATARAARAALADVMDPELPMVSIGDLGMIGDVSVDGARGAIRVEILPTFVGCPALELIRSAVATRLANFGRPVEVVASFAQPWSSDRITDAGRAALTAAGIAPPMGVSEQPLLISLEAPVQCPYCGSHRTRLDSAFGPTQCRTVHHCMECRQPFEAIKPV